MEQKGFATLLTAAAKIEHLQLEQGQASQLAYDVAHDMHAMAHSWKVLEWAANRFDQRKAFSIIEAHYDRLIATGIVPIHPAHDKWDVRRK